MVTDEFMLALHNAAIAAKPFDADLNVYYTYRNGNVQVRAIAKFELPGGKHEFKTVVDLDKSDYSNIDTAEKIGRHIGSIITRLVYDA